MKPTGIVRRIDDLGRVVIPREIRKNMRIKDGDPLEIYIDDDAVVFKKYSSLGVLEEFAKDMVKTFKSDNGIQIFITDTFNILASREHKMDRGKITNDLYKIIRETICVEEYNEVVKITQNIELPIKLIVPIYAEGNIIGTICATGDSDVNDADKATIIYISELINTMYENK